EVSDLSYPRELEYLTLVRVRIAQGREHPASVFLSQAVVLLERLQEDAEVKMRMRSILEILLLRALALQAQGFHTEALTALDGASNREIAQHLVLSVNTVKKHVLNLCGKLGVQSRAQAIARTRTLNLL